MNRVFHIVVSRLDSLFTQADPSGANQATLSISLDDYKECSYLLETIHNIISVIPHNGWVTLLTQPPAQGDRHHDTSASEGELRDFSLTCQNSRYL